LRFCSTSSRGLRWLLLSDLYTQARRNGRLRGYYLALLEEEGSNLRRVVERTGLKLPALTAEFALLGMVPEERREREPRKSHQTPAGISSPLAKQLS
jgi:hypothetical protein